MLTVSQLLETRTLIKVISDPNLALPERFLLGQNFWGGATPLYSKYAEIRREKGRRSLARFRAAGQAANVVARKNPGTVVTVATPYIREKKVVEAAVINTPNTIGPVYINGGQGIVDAQKKAVADDLADLKSRQELRVEWMRWQILTTGKIQYADEQTAFEVDFEQPSDNMPTLSGADLWSASTAKIQENLKAWSKLILKATGSRGRVVILGDNAANAFVQNAAVMKALDTLNYRVGSLQIDEQTQFIGNLFGFEFRSWSGQYDDESGTEQEFLGPDYCLMLPADFRTRTETLYGAIEEFVDEVSGVQNLVGQFFSKSWVENDPAVRWMLATSRPLPIVHQAGSWVYAKVV